KRVPIALRYIHGIGPAKASLLIVQKESRSSHSKNTAARLQTHPLNEVRRYRRNNWYVNH
ncbi:MAG: hypothetical protein AAGL97_16050, partial [Pseudomonadota bacterium]